MAREVSRMPFAVHEVNLCDYDAVLQALTDASIEADRQGKIMTLERIAYVLGLNFQVLSEILHDKRIKYKDKEIPAIVIETLKKAADYCRMAVVDAGFTARNPAMHIFLCKANYHYDDKPAPAIAANTVIFIGEDEIPE